MVDKTSAGEVVRKEIDIPGFYYCAMVFLTHLNDNCKFIIVIFKLHDFRGNNNTSDKSTRPAINGFKTYFEWIVTVS